MKSFSVTLLLSIFLLSHFVSSTTKSIPSLENIPNQKHICPLPENNQDYFNTLPTIDPYLKNLYNRYIEIIGSRKFYGSWHLTNISNPKHYKEANFPSKGGAIVFNPSTHFADLALSENEYMNQKILAFSSIFHSLKEDMFFYNHGFLIKNKKLEFYVRSSILAEFFYPIKDSSSTCIVNTLSLQIIDAVTERPFDPAHDDVENLRIKVILDSECLFNFETSYLTPYDPRLRSETRLYTCIYIFWIIFNLLFGVLRVLKNRGFPRIDQLQVFQTFLALCINIYISKWHDLFVRKSMGEMWTTIALINISTWVPCVCIILKFMRTRFALFLRVGKSAVLLIAMQVAFSFSHKILLAVFIAIPWIDIIRNIFPKIRTNYDIFLYIGVLFPNIVTMGYLVLYPNNFARIAPQPNLTLGFQVFILVSYVLLPLQLGARKLIFLLKRSKSYVGVNSLKPEDSCPICMLLFTETEEEAEKALLQSFQDAIRRNNNQRSEAEVNQGENEAQKLEKAKNTGSPSPKKKLKKIVKTSCGHLFHEMCLDKWLVTKKECPYCRKNVKDMLKQE